MSTRCCAKCKTPYNCGNPGCACHAGNRDAAAWDLVLAENALTEARFHMDHYRGHRDPNTDAGFGPTRKDWGE